MMNTHLNKPHVICFGEILWDNLPSGRTAGGAPMNVAYHLNRAGAFSQLISRTGNDDAGTGLIGFCQEIGLPTTLIQQDQTYATGEVMAKVTENNEVVYDILLHAAWDHIAYSQQLGDLAAAADALVFGSLAARHQESRETLLQLLDKAKYKVLDINLRAPHYSKEVLELLMQEANLLKINDDELQLLNNWFYRKGATEQSTISFLQEKYLIEEVIVTKGGDGASYYQGNKTYSGQAYPVKVADTIGAGDSFLAAFLYQKLIGTPPEKALDQALLTGAYVAGQSGACPIYTMEDLHHFRTSYL